MKILVAVKQVPARDSTLRPDAGGSGLDETDLSWEMNEPDAYALEEALQLKHKLGGEVVAISAGRTRVQQTLREALAKGADRAIHIDFESIPAPDALGIATLLADAARAESADLILTGLQSDDLGYGQTGVLMAELLGYAHATIVMEIEPLAAKVRVKRELEDGWFQNVTLSMPAVLTIQSGIRKLRYATLMGIKKAKTKELKILKAGAATAAGSDHLSLPSRVKHSQLLTGAPPQVAKELVEKLRFEARVL